MSPASRVGPILYTILFTILVPGAVTTYLPYRLLGGWVRPEGGPVSWIGGGLVVVGAGIYFRCAWEFAVRGMGTPAPIAPTRFLITTSMHRYIRNPMYIGVALVIVGEATIFRAFQLVEYAVLFLLIAHGFVIFYEEPTLHRQFGESYDEYQKKVPRWLPKF